jgi:hypothetical protein
MQGHATGEHWRCADCGDVIGAYEPVVMVGEGQVRRTSRTAELRAGRLESEHYHLACYLRTHAQVPAA